MGAAMFYNSPNYKIFIMKQISSRTAFWLITGMGLLLFASTWWFMAFSGTTATWVQSVCFFALAHFCAARYRDQLSLGMIGLALILGRLLLELPVRIMDIRSGFATLIVTFICILSIILGILCYKEKRPIVYALSIIIGVVLNTFVLQQWAAIYSPNDPF